MKKAVIKIGRILLSCLGWALGLALIGCGISVCVLAGMSAISLMIQGRPDPAGLAGLICLAGAFGAALGRGLTGRLLGITASEQDNVEW
ncbi:MAG: hypothetical protein ACM3NH_01820 [Candidatus Saccharibacteria bacterium]